MKSSFSIKREDSKLLREINAFAKRQKVKLYIVGGYLRDIFLNRDRENPDIDFCLKYSAIKFGRSLAREIKAGFVVLDQEHGACRLVKKIAGKAYTLDFTDFRGKNLEEDLFHRDFSFNSICVELDRLAKGEKLENILIDLHHGRGDLRAKIVRVINQTAFDEDPLRILRAFSFSAILGFKIEKATLQLIKLKKNKLAQVSGERIRDEFFKILARRDAFPYLRQLDKLKILKLIIPEIEMMRHVKQGPYHHLDVWEHTLETLRQLETVMKDIKNNQPLKDYLDEVISGERRRGALIKLGALLHDIGKPRAKRREEGRTKFHGHERIGLEFTENICQRLRLSNDELDALGKMVLWHLRPGYLADNREITPRAIFRYFRDTAKEGVSVLLISIADQRATKGPLTSPASRIRHEKTVLNLIKRYFKKQKEKKFPRLITGDDLIKQFKLSPSPLIGKILSEVEELQAIGKIKTKKEALGSAKRFLK